MNKVVLMGRLTATPELRYTQTSNIPRCTFTIAVDRRFAKQGEERQTDFFTVVAWRSTAEFVAKYFDKGLRVAVVGSLQNRSWESDGKKHTVTEVVADEVYFADAKRGDAYEPGSDDFDYDTESDDWPF